MDPEKTYRVYIAAWTCFFEFWAEAFPILMLPQDDE